MSKLSASGAVILQTPPKYLQRDVRDPYPAADFSDLVRHDPRAPATLHAAMTTLVRHHGASEVLRAAKIATGDLDEKTLEAAQREVLLGRGRR